jgi:LysM repeat protein
MKLRFCQNLLLILGGLLISACSSAAGGITTPAASRPIFLYQTATLANSTPAGAEATAAQPSATPQIYVVVLQDTLFGIAARHDITVEELRAANPNVDPLLLTPGTELVIPVAGAAPGAALPSPTPVPLQTGPVNCYSSALGELWCFFLVQNINEEPIENPIGQVDLLSADGEVLTSLEAVPPLNVLSPGQAMPLVAYSAEPAGEWVSARGQLLSAYSLAAVNDYYLEVDLQGVSIEISDAGSSARIAGQAKVAGEQPAGEVWVLAVAYDVEGNVVGVRRWEGLAETQFEFWVYSLGPEIAEVKLLVEARP